MSDKTMETFTPNERDVLSGRGKGILNHPGNQVYLNLVKRNKENYARCLLQSDKTKISRSIVLAIREQGGHFLKNNPDDNTWFDIGDAQAVTKVGQALREGQREYITPLLSNDQHIGSALRRADGDENYVPVVQVANPSNEPHSMQFAANDESQEIEINQASNVINDDTHPISPTFPPNKIDSKKLQKINNSNNQNLKISDLRTSTDQVSEFNDPSFIGNSNSEIKLNGRRVTMQWQSGTEENQRFVPKNDYIDHTNWIDEMKVASNSHHKGVATVPNEHVNESEQNERCYTNTSAFSGMSCSMMSFDSNAGHSLFTANSMNYDESISSNITHTANNVTNKSNKNEIEINSTRPSPYSQQESHNILQKKSDHNQSISDKVASRIFSQSDSSFNDLIYSHHKEDFISVNTASDSPISRTEIMNQQSRICVSHRSGLTLCGLNNGDLKNVDHSDFMNKTTSNETLAYNGTSHFHQKVFDPSKDQTNRFTEQNHLQYVPLNDTRSFLDKHNNSDIYKSAEGTPNSHSHSKDLTAIQQFQELSLHDLSVASVGSFNMDLHLTERNNGTDLTKATNPTLLNMTDTSPGSTENVGTTEQCHANSLKESQMPSATDMSVSSGNNFSIVFHKSGIPLNGSIRTVKSVNTISSFKMMGSCSSINTDIFDNESQKEQFLDIQLDGLSTCSNFQPHPQDLFQTNDMQHFPKRGMVDDLGNRYNVVFHPSASALSGMACSIRTLESDAMTTATTSNSLGSNKFLATEFAPIHENEQFENFTVTPNFQNQHNFSNQGTETSPNNEIDYSNYSYSIFYHPNISTVSGLGCSNRTFATNDIDI